MNKKIILYLWVTTLILVTLDILSTYIALNFFSDYLYEQNQNVIVIINYFGTNLGLLVSFIIDIILLILELGLFYYLIKDLEKKDINIKFYFILFFMIFFSLSVQRFFVVVNNIYHIIILL